MITEEDCKQSKNILIYTGFSSTPWNHTTMIQRGLGGAETCVAKLAPLFPKDYTIYICGGVEEEHTESQVYYVGFNRLHALLATTPFYATIISRYIGFLEDYKVSTYKLYVWLHDINILKYAWNRHIDIHTVLEKWNSKINNYICLSNWHKQNTGLLYPEIKDKIKVIPNGINAIDATISALKPSAKVPNRFVFTSCPERGYTKLFELWNEILKHIPEATLKLATYISFPRTAEESKQIEYIKRTPSIEFLGRLSPADLYTLHTSAEYWLYPTNFLETFCITGMEMLNNQVISFYYPIGALPNTVGDYGIPLRVGDEIAQILEVVNDKEKKESIRKRGLEYAQGFDWTFIIKYWNELLELN